MDIPRSREADAFLTTVHDADPSAVSACDGWTTHEIAAHVTGIAVEVLRHLRPFEQGEAVPETRGFEEREAPLQAMSHSALLRRLDEEEQAMRRLVGDILAEQPDAVIPWTGRTMAVAKFIPHLRNEHAVHRWDLAGDDDVSEQLLGDDELVGHSVGELGRVLLVAGREKDPDPDRDFCVRLHSAGHADLEVAVAGGEARLRWADRKLDGADGDEGAADIEVPTVDIDSPARHVFIWGRRPDRRARIFSHLAQPDLARLQALLSGY